MAEGKKITDLGVEPSVDKNDLILIGSGGSSSLTRATVKQLLDLIYPVGFSIYTEKADYDPNDSIGGRWVREKGVFLFAADETNGIPIGTRSGKQNVTLKVENLPSHQHSMTEHTHPIPGHTHAITVSETALTTAESGAHRHKLPYDKDVASGTSKNRYNQTGNTMSSDATNEAGKHTHTIPAHTHNATCASNSASNTGINGTVHTGYTGSGKAIENMPPYKAVYVWTRKEL